MGRVEPMPFGFNNTVYYSFTDSNIIEISKYKQKYKETMDYASKANVRWWRAMGKFEWGSIQPDGPEFWNWSDEDSLVKWAGKKDLHILAVLGSQSITPEWAANKKISNYEDFGKCYPPDSLYWNDYSTFIKALVERYDGDGKNDMQGLTIPIKHWEFSNEPYKKYFWGTPKQFINMFKKTRKAIIEADSEAIIVGPCLTSSQAKPFEWTYYNTEKEKVDKIFFTDWIEAQEYIINGIGIEKIDVISHHLYHNPTNFFTYVNELRNLLQNIFKAYKPIWITEYGSQNSDKLEVNYKKPNNKANCKYPGFIGKSFYGKVTVQYNNTEKVIVDTFLYLGDTVRLYDRNTYMWDTLYNFQGGTITHKDGNIALQEGDTIQIHHIWLENINHTYKTQKESYQKLFNRFDKEFLENFKVFFFCLDNWTYKRNYPTEVIFGNNKPTMLYRVKMRSQYTIIDPEEGPQGAYYIINNYMKSNFP
jgi:hypothetical protein